MYGFVYFNFNIYIGLGINTEGADTHIRGPTTAEKGDQPSPNTARVCFYFDIDVCFYLYIYNLLLICMEWCFIYNLRLILFTIQE